MPKRRTPYSRFACEVGNQLRTVRLVRNLTQSDVAQAVGLKQSAWSQIELGYKPLTMHQLSLAAGRLGIRPSDVVCSAEAQILWQLAKQQGASPLSLPALLLASFAGKLGKP